MVTLRNADQANPSSNPSGRTFFYEIKVIKYTNRCMINLCNFNLHTSTIFIKCIHISEPKTNIKKQFLRSFISGLSLIEDI